MRILKTGKGGFIGSCVGCYALQRWEIARQAERGALAYSSQSAKLVDTDGNLEWWFVSDGVPR